MLQYKGDGAQDTNPSINCNYTVLFYNFTLNNYQYIINTNTSVFDNYTLNAADLLNTTEYQLKLIFKGGYNLAICGTNFYETSFISINYSRLNIIIRNELTNILITSNVSLRFTINSNDFTNYTSSGLYSLLDYINGIYSIFASATGYGSRIYTLTLNDTSINYLNVYLAANTSITQFTISDKDSTELLSDVLITQYSIINNSWAALESKYSDVTGKSQFNYIPNINYKFLLSKSGYQTYVFYLSPILFSSYDIGLTKDTTSGFVPDNYFISIAYSPSYFKNGTTVNFGFIIGSPGGELSEYGINLSYPGAYNSTYGVNSIGGQLNITLPISASLGDTMKLDYYYITGTSGRRNFTVNFPIVFDLTGYNMTMAANKDNTYGLGIFERILILVFIILGIAGIAALIGQLVLGMVLGLFVMGYLSFIGFIPVWSILISILMGFFIIAYKSGSAY